MGGTALGEQLSRLSRSKYLAIVKELQTHLQPKFFGYVEPQRSLPDKESFGDVDLIVADNHQIFVPQQHIHSRKSLTNGNITSFEYDGHQVDLIKVGRTENIDLIRLCCDYGDLGMIVGMLVRGISMKFGHTGLSISIENHKLKLSRSLPDILQFLGYDVEQWRLGFTTEKEIFDFITSSKYFQTKLFRKDDGLDLIESENERSVWNRDVRKRHEKRPMFSRFVAYVQTLPVDCGNIDLYEIRKQAFQYFDKEEEAKVIELKIQQNKRIKTKFNGSLVREWSNGTLSGQALGKFIAVFKKKYTEDELDRMTEIDIQTAVMNQLQYYQEH